MSDNGANVGILVSIGSIIGTVVGFLTFWTRLTDKISDAAKTAEIADKKAADALQEAAEAKNDFATLREAHDEMSREMHDQVERLRRESGENFTAIRQHVTDVAFFMRDNFVRRPEFEAATSKIDAAQMRMDTKLDRILEQIRGDSK